MRHVLTPLVLALLLGPAPGRGAEPGLHSFSLDNGLKVVVIEDHRAPVVTQMVWYQVGAAEDPPGKAGTAHFLEHLMFKATGRLGDGEYSRVVEENGGSDNAFTSIDRTAFVSRMAADRLDLVMGMEADRMVNLAPSETSVLSERDVVIEERRQEVDGDPGGALQEQLMAALYPNSPDGRPVIGPEDEIAGLTRDGAMAFYRGHYAPNNAILVVAGDVDVDEVRAMAERHFGPIPAAPLVARAERPQVRPLRAAPGIEVQDARAAFPQLTRLYLAPPRRAGDQKTAAALVLLADLLGGARVTSVMARDLVAADGAALAAGASYNSLGINEQNFGFYVVPKPGVDPAEAEAALDTLIGKFLEDGPDPAEVERIRGRVRAENIFALDDASGRANEVGLALTSGLTLADVEAWPDALAAVTAEDMTVAARSVFRPENSVTGWLMPLHAAAPEVAQ